jgi:hypothetical protein
MENDYIVRPVENLQNVSGITPAKHREEKNVNRLLTGKMRKIPSSRRILLRTKTTTANFQARKTTRLLSIIVRN